MTISSSSLARLYYSRRLLSGTELYCPFQDLLKTHQLFSRKHQQIGNCIRNLQLLEGFISRFFFHLQIFTLLLSPVLNSYILVFNSSLVGFESSLGTERTTNPISNSDAVQPCPSSLSPSLSGVSVLVTGYVEEVWGDSIRQQNHAKIGIQMFLERITRNVTSASFFGERLYTVFHFSFNTFSYYFCITWML